MNALSSSVVVIVIALATVASAQSQEELLTFDLNSPRQHIQRKTGDGFVVRAENHNDTRGGWDIGVYRVGSSDNLLYPKGNWHGSFPCQIVPMATVYALWGDERQIEVRDTDKVLTIRINHPSTDSPKDPFRFTGGVVGVFWGRKQMQTSDGGRLLNRSPATPAVRQ